MNIIGIVVAYIYIFLIILIAKAFEKFGREIVRKFIHIMLGNCWIILLIFFDNVYFASFVPASFIIINLISYKTNIISIMERDKKNQDGLGTVYYAISLFVIAIITFLNLAGTTPLMGIVPVFIMAYGDGLAAIIGTKVKSPKYRIGKSSKKSLAGSITMFVVSLLIISIYYLINPINYWVAKAIIMSVIITILEAISIKGTDNITVPIGTLLMMILVA